MPLICEEKYDPFTAIFGARRGRLENLPLAEEDAYHALTERDLDICRRTSLLEPEEREVFAAAKEDRLVLRGLPDEAFARACSVIAGGEPFSGLEKRLNACIRARRAPFA